MVKKLAAHITSKVVNFRPKSVEQVEHNFHCGLTDIDLAKTYTYLGFLSHEHNNLTVSAQALAQSASKALSVLLCIKTRHFWGLGCATFPELSLTGIASISDYGSGVWGYKKATCFDNVQHRPAIRAFLGVGKYTPNLGLDLMGWNSSYNRRQTHMVRFLNIIQSMENDRLPNIFNGLGP